MKTPIILAVAAVGLIVLILGYIFSAHAAAVGWLVAFVYCGGIVIGSLGLTLIHRLTGGGWFGPAEPTCGPLSTVLPALVIAIIPVFASIGLIFDWVDLRETVSRFWLNVPFYVVRSVLLLAALSVAAFLARRHGRSQPVATIGIILYGFATSVFAVDWVLALRPETMFTAYGAFFAIEQLATALTLSILLAPEIPRQAASDLAGLLIAIVMGLTYLGFMDFMIAWYSNVPARIAWYAARIGWPWFGFLLGALAFGFLIPFAHFLSSRTRFVTLHLKFGAASILLGAALYDCWLIAPTGGPPALGFAAAGVLLLGTLGIGVVRGGLPVGRREAAHG